MKANELLDRIFSDPQNSTPIVVRRSNKVGEFEIAYDKTVVGETWKRTRAHQLVGIFSGLEPRHQVAEKLKHAFDGMTEEVRLAIAPDVTFSRTI